MIDAQRNRDIGTNAHVVEDPMLGLEGRLGR
jgi:hypothetical protein